MNFSFHPEAADELIRSIDYYEACRKSLGYEFSLEVYAAIDRVMAFPLAWPIVEKSIRRCLTNRFPFGILYECHENDVFIVAVMELHQRPGYWKKRTEKVTDKAAR